MNLHTHSDCACSNGRQGLAETLRGNIFTRLAGTLGRVSLSSVILLTTPVPAAYAARGDVCMVDRCNDMNGAGLYSLNFTASDVMLEIYENEL